MRETGEALAGERTSLWPTLEGVRVRKRGSESLSLSEWGDWCTPKEVEDMEAWASALRSEGD